MGFQAHPGARRRAALALRAVDLRSKCHHPRRIWSMLREAAGAPSACRGGLRGRPYSPNPVSTGRYAKGGGLRLTPILVILQRSDGVRPTPRGNPAQNRPAATLTYATTYETFSALLRAHVAMTMRDGLAKKTAR